LIKRDQGGAHNFLSFLLYLAPIKKLDLWSVNMAPLILTADGKQLVQFLLGLRNRLRNCGSSQRGFNVKSKRIHLQLGVDVMM